VSGFSYTDELMKFKLTENIFSGQFIRKKYITTFSVLDCNWGFKNKGHWIKFRPSPRHPIPLKQQIMTRLDGQQYN
jgi:hypothetical protein